jgi:hypothetical protein
MSTTTYIIAEMSAFLQLSRERGSEPVRNLLDCRIILPLKDKRPTMTKKNDRFKLKLESIITGLSFLDLIRNPSN